jgi:DNA-binding MarR family transcriptional regulator
MSDETAARMAELPGGEREQLVRSLREAMDHLTSIALSIQSQLLRPFGLTVIQTLALKMLWEHGEPIDMVQLAEDTTLPPSTLTSVVDRLERDGLARRMPHPTDRRRVHVSITGEGRKLLEEFDDIGVKTATAMLDGVSDEDVAVTRDVLVRLANALMHADLELPASLARLRVDQ